MMCEIENEELLEIFVEAYNNYKDYVYRLDGVCWSEEAEQQAYDKYDSILQEVLKRMEK